MLNKVHTKHYMKREKIQVTRTLYVKIYFQLLIGNQAMNMYFKVVEIGSMTDDILNLAEITVFVYLSLLKNIVKKEEEKAVYQHFLHFP